jgi:predicted enzyme involved in methoxymalonyl-ACP biosynthesis
VADRFADHGLVGAAVIEDGEITGLVMSCRVLGMGIEHAFVQHVLAASGTEQITATIVPTARNIPVRNIYRDNGFVLGDDGGWRWKSVRDAPDQGSYSSRVLVSDVGR